MFAMTVLFIVLLFFCCGKNNVCLSYQIPAHRSKYYINLYMNSNSVTEDNMKNEIPSSTIKPVLPTLDYITFVSGNNLKKVEVNAILTGAIPCTLLFDSVEFDEPQATPIEISQAKCRQAVENIKGPCLVEDTSLCFNALNGLPGPYIKWFIESLGNEGLSRLLDSFEDKSAYSQCVVSFSLGVGHEVVTFVGVAEGEIVKPVGPFGFGWDSVFKPTGSNLTFAQMPKAQKNKSSHRFKAMSKFKTYMNSHFTASSDNGDGSSS